MKPLCQHFVLGCTLAVLGGAIVWTMFVCKTFACIPDDDDRPDADNFSGPNSPAAGRTRQSTRTSRAS